MKNITAVNPFAKDQALSPRFSREAIQKKLSRKAAAKNLFKSLKKLTFVVALLPMFGCASPEEFDGTYYVVPFQEEMIVLQNLKSRVIAYCYPSLKYSADDCAASFEHQGFVRLRDIPRFPAKDDFLKSDTYPTRRWRKDDKAPRW